MRPPCFCLVLKAQQHGPLQSQSQRGLGRLLHSHCRCSSPLASADPQPAVQAARITQRTPAPDGLQSDWVTHGPSRFLYCVGGRGTHLPPTLSGHSSHPLRHFLFSYSSPFLTSWSLSTGSIQPMKIITKAAFKRKQKPSLNTIDQSTSSLQHSLHRKLPAFPPISFDLLISSPLFNHRGTVPASKVSSSLWSTFRNANPIAALPCFISHCCQGEPEFLSGGHTKCFEMWPIITPPAFSLIHYESPLSILSSGNSATQITFWFSEFIREHLHALASLPGYFLLFLHSLSPLKSLSLSLPI